MNPTLYARGLAEHWRGPAVTAVSIGAMLVLGLYVYQGIDLSIYDVLPDAVRALMGIPEGADASVLAYNEMLAAIGALAFGGVAISIGASAVARDEGAGRSALLLATPTSRTALAASRAAAFVTVVVLGGAALWGIAAVAPVLLDVDAGKARVLALMVHLTANGLFHGALAFAVATATGRRGLGSGVASTVMVGGWLASGLLPMWREGSADWVPWTWFNGTKPLVNGIDGGNLALLLGGALLFLVLGVVVFPRRELRSAASAGAHLVERLRARLDSVMGRTRRTRGTSPLAIRLADHQGLVAYIALLLALVMGLAMPPLYTSLDSVMGDFALSFPDSMSALFGGGDLTTAAGFLHLETFGMVAPICVILIATAAASAGIAGEERAGRMSVLLAQPLGRSRVFWTTAVTVALYVLVVAAALFGGMWAGLSLVDLDVSIPNLAWASFLLWLLGCFFGALALAISAATGRPGATIWGTTAVATVTYFGYTLLLAGGREELGLWSPFAAYLHGPVLAEGIEWWQPVWLGVGILVLLPLGLLAWLRRDVRAVRG